ncbi:MAG: hypothetical protein M1272_08505 [Firmicutes bacterium]|nr:hypothetical protein [Bacillota bacterium]
MKSQYPIHHIVSQAGYQLYWPTNDNQWVCAKHQENTSWHRTKQVYSLINQCYLCETDALIS